MKATEQQSDFPPSDNSEQVIRIALSIHFPHIDLVNFKLDQLCILLDTRGTIGCNFSSGKNERIISIPFENKTY